jgi:hypothetical protein
MANRFRPLAACAAGLVLAFGISPAPSTFAHTGASDMPVSLVISDVCTLETSVQRPTVACVAGGQYRVLSGEFFANLRAGGVKAFASNAGAVVEIAF